MARPKRLSTLVEAYLAELETKQYAVRTIEKYRSVLRIFVAWAEDRRLVSAARVSAEALDAYRAVMREEGLSAKTIAGTTSVLRGFFQYLVRQGEVAANPVVSARRARTGLRLPKATMTAPEIDHLLDLIDVSTVAGLRDRAMIEVLYSSGLRRAELAALRIADVDRKRGILTVRRGKGGRDRVVPIGARALHWVDRYLQEVRPRQLQSRRSLPDPGTVFVSKYGAPMNPATVTERCKLRVAAAGIAKNGAAHAFRHAAATLMLEHGADIRYVQAFLGHRSVDTTVLYTHVAIQTLCVVHRKYHPRG